MTPAQRILAAVRRYYARHGIPPTVYEVADNLKLTVAAVYQAAQASNAINLTWTGPRPALGAQVMELVENEELK